MASPQNAVALRRNLRRQLNRADTLAARCLSQVCDGDVRWVDRETAQSRLNLTLRAARDLDRQLERVNDFERSVGLQLDEILHSDEYTPEKHERQLQAAIDADIERNAALANAKREGRPLEQ